MGKIPEGFCHCGCGGKTSIATRNHKIRGWVKGEPLKFIHGHNCNGKNNPAWKGGRMLDKDGYVLIYSPNHPQRSAHGYVREHILIAEKALGKPLPLGAVVHHANGVKGDNGRGNHVICQDEKYHRFLDTRLRAFKACGHANWRKCNYCKNYDDPIKLTIDKHGHVFHGSCRNLYQRNKKGIISLTP